MFENPKIEALIQKESVRQTEDIELIIIHKY